MDKQIIEIMERVFEQSGLDTKTSQENCGKWDSLRHLNLIVELEDTFDMEFEPEEIAEMKSFDAVKRIISQKLG